MKEEDIVSINWVLKQLKMSDAPRSIALASLEALVRKDQLTIYFNDETFGVRSEDGYELVHDIHGEVTGALTNGGYGETHDGLKVITSFTVHKVEGEYLLSVSEYKFKSIKYYPTDKTSMWLNFITLDEDHYYFKRQDIEKLKTSELAKPISNYPSRSHTGAKGALKALALLAREKAISNKSFRHGNNVNASKFKTHIIELAYEYLIDDKSHQPDSALLKLDEKINDELNKLDLKDIDKEL